MDGGGRDGGREGEKGKTSGPGVYCPGKQSYSCKGFHQTLPGSVAVFMGTPDSIALGFQTCGTKPQWLTATGWRTQLSEYSHFLITLDPDEPSDINNSHGHAVRSQQVNRSTKRQQRPSLHHTGPSWSIMSERNSDRNGKAHGLEGRKTWDSRAHSLLHPLVHKILTVYLTKC